MVSKEERAQRCPSVSGHHAAAWFLAIFEFCFHGRTAASGSSCAYAVCNTIRVCFARELFFSSYLKYMVYVVQQRHEVNESTRATRTIVPVRCLLLPDSLSAVFAFLESLSSVVGMIQGRYDTRCDCPGCVCCVGIPRSPTSQVPH